MTEATDWNSKTIAEFRANEGRVGGPFEGAPMVLVHHRGRKSGREYVNPTMYLPPARAASNAEPSPTRSPSASRPAPNATASTPIKPAATPASPTTSGKPLASEPSPCSSSRARRPRRTSYQSSAPSNRSRRTTGSAGIWCGQPDGRCDPSANPQTLGLIPDQPPVQGLPADPPGRPPP
jgi:hypothetical protein